ncbi:MAG: transcriptional repressor LexA, partial [Candidatus Sumerlaeota bacterium]|nr:transcriptional repressor LexA [Candidatus Sumerlaeota bacterium]
MYLTKRQKQVLDYIESFIREHGYSPSLEEIGKGLKLSSLATVHKHLTNLQIKGVMRRLPNRSRSIELESVPMFAGEGPALRLMGEIAAGLPIETYPDDAPTATIEAPREFVTSPDNYVLRVRGDSMIEESIADGDYIICEARERAENGETVVALIDGHEATVKKFYAEGGVVRLQPANEKMQPQFYAPERVTIQGVVV